MKNYILLFMKGDQTMKNIDLVAKKIFLTKGIGYHKNKLAAFEEALRDAGIANQNLVMVSSIFPPHCKIISKKQGSE